MNEQPSSAGYPLSALFLAVAAAAVVISLAAPVIGSLSTGQVGVVVTVVAWSVGLGCLGAVLGGFLGLYHYRRLRGVGWGVLSGLVMGACLGPVATSRNFDQVAMSCVTGSLLLIGIGAFCRISARRSQP